jgi:hypothetical protein
LWLDWGSLLSREPEALAENLLLFHRRHFAWEENAYCGSCCWRYVCGGIDAWPGHSALPAGVLDAGCHHRKLFLESLAWEKRELVVADFSSPSPSLR